ncbi:hypothetical protein ACOMHN_041191 [Nucella lapillus]
MSYECGCVPGTGDKHQMVPQTQKDSRRPVRGGRPKEAQTQTSTAVWGRSDFHTGPTSRPCGATPRLHCARVGVRPLQVLTSGPHRRWCGLLQGSGVCAARASVAVVYSCTSGRQATLDHYYKHVQHRLQSPEGDHTTCCGDLTSGPEGA